MDLNRESHDDLSNASGQRAPIRAVRALGRLLVTAHETLLPMTASRVAAALIALAILVGFWFRARGMFGGIWGTILPFWLDEVLWADRVATLPLSESLFRPLGFMAVSKLFVKCCGVGEVSLRMLPWASSVLTLLIAPFLAARLFRSAVACVAFVWLIAVHPAAIDLAREFKPYSVSLAAHALGILLTLRALEEPSARRVTGLVAALLAGILFAQDIVFLWPASFLLIGVRLLRARAYRLLLGAVAGAVLCAAVAVGFYFTMWRVFTSESDYWGGKYGVFYIPGSASDGLTHRLAWTATKYGEMAAYPGLRAELPRLSAEPGRSSPPVYATPWLELNRSAWLALHVLGVGALALRRRWSLLALFGIPLLTLTALNWFMLWPYGVFRVNLFLLLGMTAIPLFVVDAVAGARLAHVALAILLTGLTAAPLALEKRWGAEKVADSWSSRVPQAVRRLIALQRSEPRVPLLLDHWSCAYWMFYTDRHSRFSARWGARARAKFEMSCGLTARAVRDHTAAALANSPRAWVFLSSPRTIRPIERELRRHTKVVSREVVGTSHVLLKIERKPSRR